MSSKPYNKYKKAVAIDPEGCGCTECLTGLYVPLDQATIKQIKKMLKGDLSNHTYWTNEEWQDAMRVVIDLPNGPTINL